MLKLTQIKRTEPKLLLNMSNHYSLPKGFVGRNICYSITYNSIYYGAIVGGSSTRFLPGRDKFFAFKYESELVNIVNNIFFHVEKVNNLYPRREFLPFILKEYRNRVEEDWYKKYKDIVIGHESLVELPRTGECYIRDGWTHVGVTKGYTCKRVAESPTTLSTDSWSGARVWDTKNLRPKNVFCRVINYEKEIIFPPPTPTILPISIDIWDPFKSI